MLLGGGWLGIEWGMHGIELIEPNRLYRELPMYGGFASLELLSSIGPTETLCRIMTPLNW